jgi:hypothetical protein
MKGAWRAVNMLTIELDDHPLDGKQRVDGEAAIGAATTASSWGGRPKRRWLSPGSTTSTS